MAKPELTYASGSTMLRGDRTFSWLLLGPGVFILGAVSIFPLLYSLWTAFVEFNIRSQSNPFVGFDNFASALTDPGLRRAAIWTLAIAAVTAGLETILGTGIALAMFRSGSLTRRILLPILIAPMFISPVVAAQIWRNLVARSYGPFNYVVGLFTGGFDVDLLADRYWNMVTVVVVDMWQWTALPLILVYSAMTALDTDLLDAAAVDGATGWERTRYIVLPLISPALLTALVFRFADSLRMYGNLVVLTSGGPGDSTKSISFVLIERGFRGSFDIAFASAASWLFMILTVVLFYRLMRRAVFS